ncbi:MAG: helix-turn-helix transcriptional regulator [Anaerolineae bacterium]|nr:helix-turn-helix transcriptional regulator [Anaerolineae bacterium]
MKTKSIGNWAWIQTALERRSLSVSSLAHVLGVVPQAVRKWLKGASDPSAEHLIKLANIFTGGDLNELAARAGMNRVDELLNLNAQLRAFASPVQAPLIDQPAFIDGTAHTVIESNRLLIEAYRYREAKLQSQRMIAHLLGHPPSLLTARMWCDLARAENMLGNYAQAIEAATEAQTADRKRLTTVQLAETHGLIADILRAQGNLTESRARCDEAIRLYRHTGASPFDDNLIWVMFDLSRLADLEGRPSEALRYCEEVRERSKHKPYLDGLSLEVWQRARIHEMLGDLGQAHLLYLEARQRCRDIGYTLWEALSTWRIAEVLRKQGQLLAALDLAERTASTFAQMENHNQQATLWTVSAACWLHLGQIKRATNLYTRALAQAGVDDDVSLRQRATLGLQLGALALESAKPQPNYAALLAQALAHWATLVVHSHNIGAYISLHLAELFRLSGNAAEAHNRYAALAHRCAESGHQLEQAHGLLGAAACKRPLGQDGRADAQNALTIYNRIGCGWGQVQARNAIALTETSGTETLHQSSQPSNRAGVLLFV